MADTAIANISKQDAELAAIAATKNDLSLMNDTQRAQLYGAVCKSIGLNPLTSPFEFIKLNGKLTLYAKKGATDQIRDIRGISITSIDQRVFDGVLMVTATAQDSKGRIDSDIGAVVVKGLTGEALANAHMKALTKAKRRVTLSIAGLGFLDESEVESIPANRVQPVQVNHQTGQMSATIEVIDEDGVIEDAPPASDDREHADPEWLTAANHLAKLVSKYKITNDEGKAMLRKWGVPSAKLEDMSADQLRKACDFIEKRGDKIKPYVEQALADEKELAEINQQPLEV